MNKYIGIENFKCFARNTEIKLGKITANAGMNSVGKSSVIQALLLLRQIYDAAYMYRDTKINEYTVDLNGKYGLQLGDSQHIKSSEDKEDVLLNIDGMDFRLHSILRYPLQLRTVCPYPVNELQSYQGIFSDDFYYLNAERLGPRNYQNIVTSDHLGCGIHGENTFHFVSQHMTDRVGEK